MNYVAQSTAFKLTLEPFFCRPILLLLHIPVRLVYKREMQPLGFYCTSLHRVQLAVFRSTNCGGVLDFCLLLWYDTQRIPAVQKSTCEVLQVRPSLYQEKLSWVESSLAYPSYPRRPNFFYISLQNFANCLYKKPFFDGGVTLLAGPSLRGGVGGQFPRNE